MMRDKQRYVLVEAYPDADGYTETFWNQLSDELLRCIGETNYHITNPKFVKFVGKNTFIIRTTVPGAAQVILSLALIKNLNGKEIAFYTLKTSGTIRALLGREKTKNKA
jgi:RNase P/RNase MRP subunit POP5